VSQCGKQEDDCANLQGRVIDGLILGVYFFSTFKVQATFKVFETTLFSLNYRRE